MKNNYRPIVGFLCIKITRKGSYIVGNKKYIKEILFNNEEIKFDNVLFFNKECNEILQKKGFGNVYFMTDFESFLIYNKEQLFKIDIERQQKIKKALDMLKKINHKI